jgi:hypothetical protein
MDNLVFAIGSLAKLPRLPRLSRASFRYRFRWPDSPGISGRFAMESVAGFPWKGWPVCRGISGRFHVEYALNELPEENPFKKDVVRKRILRTAIVVVNDVIGL